MAGTHFGQLGPRSDRGARFEAGISRSKPSRKGSAKGETARKREGFNRARRAPPIGDYRKLRLLLEEYGTRERRECRFRDPYESDLSLRSCARTYSAVLATVSVC